MQTNNPEKESNRDSVDQRLRVNASDQNQVAMLFMQKLDQLQYGKPLQFGPIQVIKHKGLVVGEGSVPDKVVFQTVVGKKTLTTEVFLEEVNPATIQHVIRRMTSFGTMMVLGCLFNEDPDSVIKLEW